MAPDHNKTNRLSKSIQPAYLHNNNNNKKKRRPRKPQSCDDVNEALKYRAQILREITNNLSRIHDLLLTEYQIRDINDSINNLLKERRNWEYRIKQLGGADFTNVQLHNSKDLLSIKGYKYFGRARELPDVVKLLNEAKSEIDKSHTKNKNNQSLKLFSNQENWPEDIYYFDEVKGDQFILDSKSDKFSSPFQLKNNDSPLIDFDLTVNKKSKLITQNAEFMESFLLDQKKKFLLQRLRTKRKE